jgi:diguanylate cyclase (GGDEF)-like protein/putative nucleotidyltransferase with HDIG domain
MQVSPEPTGDNPLCPDPAEEMPLLDAHAKGCLDRLTRLAATVIDAPMALVSFVDGEVHFVVISNGLAEPWGNHREVPEAHSICRQVVTHGEAVAIGDARTDERVRDNPAVAQGLVVSYLGVPLIGAENAIVGALCVADQQPRTWSLEQASVLEELATSAMTELLLRQSLREEERRSRTDALTGLANRRAMDEAIELEVVRSRRENRPLGLLLIDIDRFKAVNDTYGHPAGDLALIEVARRLRSGVRGYDLVGRWGGEEFAVLMPGIPDEASLGRAGDGLRRAVSSGEPIDLGPEGSTTLRVSVGGAHARPGGATPQKLADEADTALYAAKRRGRDQCVIAGQLTPADRAAEAPDSVRVAMALARASCLREGVSDIHCLQVASLSEATARHLKLDEDLVLRCRLGGWLHDVGKVAMPESVLAKPGPLDESERLMIQAHPEIGAHIVGDSPGICDAAGAIRHHHERYDGSGYPAGLAGKDIPIEARIVAAADAFSAMTSDRVYRRQITIENAIEELRHVAGSHLDPEVVDALIAALAARDAKSGPAYATAVEEAEASISPR